MIIREPAEDLLRPELARIDEMIAAIYGAAVQGDLKAIETILRI